MTDLSKIELHDALLKRMIIDYDSKSVTIEVDFYRSDNVCDRKSALIIFEGVESLSQVNNIAALKNHAFAGHINEWAPIQDYGTTYIDVVGGCIAIKAEKIRFEHATLINRS